MKKFSSYILVLAFILASCGQEDECDFSKINSALQRLKEGTYGFCEETGEPIGLKRLMARPVATLSIEAQERHERDEKIFVDD